ncbi:hypothetical protein [Amycolatopsis jiangsuensis]|uniref:Uncharacterized protein n=1 Tax=Amycolatopsis jiangsuensis TaxID=1181879 RepID=A0A840IQJ5_9PSEU|nr:hypothetical protein [Amycolatopsis jiangsuensis]MBB4683725.1 hypothetical protein [Amycolatopsis jiangsuensis]
MAQQAPAAGSWLAGLDFNIIDAFGAATAAGSAVGGGAGAGGAAVSTGQGFTLSRDEATAMLKDAQGIRDDLAKMIPVAERLTHLSPPAADPASNGYNNLLTGSGGQAGAFGYGLGHVQREHDYVGELISRLEKALGITQDSDSNATTDVNKAANSGGGMIG